MFEFVIHLYGEDAQGEHKGDRFTGTAYAQTHTVQGKNMEDAVEVAIARAQKKVPGINKFDITINKVSYLVIETKDDELEA